MADTDVTLFESDSALNVTINKDVSLLDGVMATTDMHVDSSSSVSGDSATVISETDSDNTEVSAGLLGANVVVTPSALEEAKKARDEAVEAMEKAETASASAEASAEYAKQYGETILPQAETYTDTEILKLATVARTGSYNDLTDKLTAGTNISIVDGVISAVGEAGEYTAGDNVQISSDKVISATDTTYTAGSNVQISEDNVISVPLPENINVNIVGTGNAVTTIASDSANSINVVRSKTFQEKLTAGTNITITEDNVISATGGGGGGETYTAGDNIQISVDNVISATDTTYSAGDNVQISDENVISATDTTYTAGDNVAISDENVISATNTTYTAGTNVSISDTNVISATDTKYTAGTNVAISDANVISSTNTWRGIQDNLTSSTNTTESLSAKQGYLLANGSAKDNSAISGLSVSGKVITYTKRNGTTGTITTQDTNTTYSAGTGISLSGTTFSNSGVRSISTGGSNGTISVNTNGSSANVSVKGLGSFAYISSLSSPTISGSVTLSSASAGVYFKDGSYGNADICAQSGFMVLSSPSGASAGMTCRRGSNLGTFTPISASKFEVSSSKRVKENIQTLTEDEAKKILDVVPVTFDYIENAGGEKNCRGVIAEDVVDIIPSVVNIPEGYDPDVPLEDCMYNVPTVDYSRFVPYLIKMVQMQNDRIDALEAEIKALKEG